MTVATSYDRQVTARHQAGHAAAAIMLRHRLPRSVTADRPEAGVFGRMVADLSDDGVSDQTAEDFLCMVLAGPSTEALDRPVPEWPLDSDSSDGDEHLVATLADFMQLDEAGYERVLERTRRLVSNPDFLRLTHLIARALELKDVLDREDLRWLVPARLAEKYDIEKEAACST